MGLLCCKALARDSNPCCFLATPLHFWLDKEHHVDITTKLCSRCCSWWRTVKPVLKFDISRQ